MNSPATSVPATGPDASSPARRLQVGDTFQTDIPIRWGDLDSLAHLNNAVYFRLMEEARAQMVRLAGVPYPPGQGMVLAHASCDFLRSFTYPETVRIVHIVTKLGRTSIECELVMSRASDPSATPYARARTVLVWVDLERSVSLPWPEPILQGLGAHMCPA